MIIAAKKRILKFPYTLPNNKGRKLSQETKQKISLAKKGQRVSRATEFKKGCIPWDKGVKREAFAGINHPRWIKDRSLIKKQEERNNPNDKQWKYAVYKRDNFKCKIANQDCNGRLEAHHILGWTDYPELRYEINNGITLCHAHHPRKWAEEKRLVPFFMGLIETKV